MIYLFILGIAGVTLFFFTRKKTSTEFIGPMEPYGPGNRGDSVWDSPEEIKQLIKEICEEEKFSNYKLAIAIAYVESNFKPNAINLDDKPPSVGVMQLKLPTARAYVPTISIQEHLFDPPSNIRAGVRFLADLTRKWAATYGLDGIIQMYNQGETRFLNGSRNITYLNRVKSYLSSWDSRDASANP